MILNIDKLSIAKPSDTDNLLTMDNNLRANAAFTGSTYFRKRVKYIAEY
jgi:hypothetical protein